MSKFCLKQGRGLKGLKVSAAHLFPNFDWVPTPPLPPPPPRIFQRLNFGPGIFQGFGWSPRDVMSNRLQFVPKRLGIETTRKHDIMCANKRNIGCQNKLNLSFVLNLNNSQNVYKQISSLWTKHFDWTHLQGRHVLSRWQWGSWLSVPLAGPGYAVPVLDTLCFSSIQCGCPRYAVPVLDTLCLSLIR